MNASTPQALVHIPNPSTPKINRAMIITDNTVEYVSNCMDCPHKLLIADPDPTDWFADKEESLMCSIHTKGEIGQRQVLEHQRERGTRAFELSNFATVNPMESWSSMLRKFADVPDWCKLKISE